MKWICNLILFFFPALSNHDSVVLFPDEDALILPPHLCAVVIIASTTSMILCKAESVPIVMSVPQKSLSMEPTIPTMWRAVYFCTASASITPERIGGIRLTVFLCRQVTPAACWHITGWAARRNCYVHGKTQAVQFRNNDLKNKPLKIIKYFEWLFDVILLLHWFPSIMQQHTVQPYKTLFNPSHWACKYH